MEEEHVRREMYFAYVRDLPRAWRDAMEAARAQGMHAPVVSLLWPLTLVASAVVGGAVLLGATFFDQPWPRDTVLNLSLLVVPAATLSLSRVVDRLVAGKLRGITLTELGVVIRRGHRLRVFPREAIAAIGSSSSSTTYTQYRDPFTGDTRATAPQDLVHSYQRQRFTHSSSSTDVVTHGGTRYRVVCSVGPSPYAPGVVESFATLPKAPALRHRPYAGPLVRTLLLSIVAAVAPFALAPAVVALQHELGFAYAAGAAKQGDLRTTRETLSHWSALRSGDPRMEAVRTRFRALIDQEIAAHWEHSSGPSCGDWEITALRDKARERDALGLSNVYADLLAAPELCVYVRTHASPVALLPGTPFSL